MAINKEQLSLWIEKAKAAGLLEDGALKEKKMPELIWDSSVNKSGSDTVAMIRLGNANLLAVSGPDEIGFEAAHEEEGIKFCELNHTNAEVLRKVFSFTAPVSLSDKDATFGVGDRLGVASVGHIRLFDKKGSFPVLAQQSVRELELTDRTYEDVLDCASWAVFQEGYKKPWGADGDHLKTEDWVKKALGIGFTMITADVSDYIRKEYDSMDEAGVLKAYEGLDAEYRSRVEKTYLDSEIKLDTGDIISFTKVELARNALIYNEAVGHAERLYNAGTQTGQEFDFEFSIDETETPTSPQAHVFAASEVQNAGVKISSLAPRFIGEFQKAIDYIGDKSQFEKEFRLHAAIARKLGYRLSIHSGSDKFGVYPTIGKYTQGRFHVKTAGTNWLEAISVIAAEAPDFYRELHKFALEVFPIAAQYYHITPNLENVPDVDKLEDKELVSIFSNPDARQVIHVTYGEMLRNAEFKQRFYDVLTDNIQSYWTALEKHIGRHLELLGD